MTRHTGVVHEQLASFNSYKTTPKERWRELSSLKLIQANKEFLNLRHALFLIDEVREVEGYRELGFDTFEDYLEKGIGKKIWQFAVLKLGLGLIHWDGPEPDDGKTDLDRMIDYCNGLSSDEMKNFLDNISLCREGK